MKPKTKAKEEFPGYPQYAQSEDIYNKAKEEQELDPEEPGKFKASIEEEGDEPEELNFEEAITGDDLDIPGAELDDEQELLGSEDEENNYYSLGDNEDRDQEL